MVTDKAVIRHCADAENVTLVADPLHEPDVVLPLYVPVEVLRLEAGYELFAVKEIAVMVEDAEIVIVLPE